MQLAPPPPPFVRPVRTLDIETYPNYFLVKLLDVHTGQLFKVEMYQGCPFRWHVLAVLIRDCTIVTFNGNGYDMIMLSAVATGRFDNDTLKRLNDFIFANKFMRSWEIAREWGFEMLDLDHIDLMPLVPGDTDDKKYAGLKIMGGRLGCKKLQDLPYDPALALTFEQMMKVDEYCGNDLELTRALYFALLEDIETRIEMNEQYGIDMRSKSDAQIAEAAMKKLLGLTYAQAKALNTQAQKPPGFSWTYTPPPFIRFSTPEMQTAFNRVLSTRFMLNEKAQIEAPLLHEYDVGFAGAVYRMGVGGLHSQEKRTHHVAGPDCVMVDIDGTSFYPTIIELLGLFPAHIGPVFLQHYSGWKRTRVAHKEAKRKRKANTYKIKLNGMFGKLKEKHSVVFDPVMFTQIVITGQLVLLMLIERMHLVGMQAIQANTDGVVIKCHPSRVDVRDAVVKQFEADTGFNMEYTHYIGVYSRDVNSYMAFKPEYTDDKGEFHPIEVKTKGEYADDPISRLAKNPANQICLDAMKAYLIHGIPLETTIRRCEDIRKFVTVRKVQGGGSWVYETVDAERVAEKRAALDAGGWVYDAAVKLWFEPCGDTVGLSTDHALKALRQSLPREFIGKTVRWYYGVGQRGHICTSKGGMVARSQGCRPCMELPDVLPPDIDYAFYVAEARSMLGDMGINA